MTAVFPRWTLGGFLKVMFPLCVCCEAVRAHFAAVDVAFSRCLAGCLRGIDLSAMDQKAQRGGNGPQALGNVIAAWATLGIQAAELSSDIGTVHFDWHHRGKTARVHQNS